MASKSLVAKVNRHGSIDIGYQPKRNLFKLSLAVLAAFFIAALAPITSSQAAQGTADVLVTHFFDTALNSATYSVRVDNPTRVTGPLCAMVYVFDTSQTLQECCGCPVRPDQMETFALTDLTGNGFSNSPVKVGTIDVVAASINHGTGLAAAGGCDPAQVFNPTPTLRAWLSNDNQGVSDGFLGASLDSVEQSRLPALCKSAVRIAAPSAICQCGN